MKYGIYWCEHANIYTVIDNENKEPMKDFVSKEDAENYIKSILGYEIIKCFLCDDDVDDDDCDFYYCFRKNQYTEKKICWSCSVHQSDEFADTIND